MRVGERPKALAMLAEQDRFAAAPARVEAMLRAKVRRRAWWRLSWMAAAPAMAAALLAAWTAVPREEPARLEISRFAPAAPEVAWAAPAMPAPAKPALANRGSRRPATGPRTFYELAYAPPEMLANSQVVRVRVPRAALLSFGLSLDAYRPVAGPVEADLIVTEDGIARAIRFVPPSQYSYQGVH